MRLDGSQPLYIRGVVQQTGTHGPALPSLFEPNLKTAWAKKHLESLKAEIDRFNQLHPYEIVSEDDTNTGHYIVKIVHPPIMRALEVVLALGDFIACLRSSLDYVAWQLALLTTPTPSREVCFPICEKNTVDTQVKIAKATFGIPDPAIAVMKSFQPYHCGEAYKSTHLWRLNMLWNLDKHRHISAFTAVPQWQILVRKGYSGGGEVTQEQIENCTIMRFPVAAKDHMEFNPEKGIQLQFFDPREGINIGYQDLVEICDFVAETVIPAFAGFFSPPEIPGKSL